MLAGLTGFYFILLGCTGFYFRLSRVHLVLLGFTGFYWVLLDFTWFYWVLLFFSGYFWVLLGFTKSYWVLLGLNVFYWIVLCYIGFYLVFLVTYLPGKQSAVELFLVHSCHSSTFSSARKTQKKRRNWFQFRWFPILITHFDYPFLFGLGGGVPVFFKFCCWFFFIFYKKKSGRLGGRWFFKCRSFFSFPFFLLFVDLFFLLLGFFFS